MFETGDYRHAIDHDDLTLSLRMSRDLLLQHWREISQTTTYLISYLEALPANDFRAQTSAAQYITNELLENAVKYARHGSIMASTGVCQNQWILLVSHATDTCHSRGLLELLHRLKSSSAEELMFRQALANAEGSVSGSSGLGLLSILVDHKALLGWRLSQPNRQETEIHTMARLNLEQATIQAPQL